MDQTLHSVHPGFQWKPLPTSTLLLLWMWPCLCWSRYFPGTGWLDFCLLLCRDWVLSLVRVEKSQRLSFWKMLPLVLFEGQAAGEIPANTGPRRRSVGKRTENLVKSVTTLNSFFPTQCHWVECPWWPEPWTLSIQDSLCPCLQPWVHTQVSCMWWWAAAVQGPMCSSDETTVLTLAFCQLL